MLLWGPGKFTCWPEMLRDGGHVVLHDSIVHDLGVKALYICLVLLGTGSFGLLISKERRAGSPLEDRS